jgi:hypothetical protein
VYVQCRDKPRKIVVMSPRCRHNKAMATLGRKSELLEIRLQADEKEAFKIAADLAGIPVSAWVRERLRRAAIIELEQVGQQIPFIQSRLGGGR